jgi:hypothetical protein
LPLSGGAARDYYLGENWQNAVVSWIDSAFLVTLISGVTPGLLWELKTIIARGHLNKLVILLPGGPEQSERWSHVCGCFAGTVWHAQMVAADIAHGLAVCFQHEQVVIIRSKIWSPAVSEVAIDLAIYSTCRERLMKRAVTQRRQERPSN